MIRTAVAICGSEGAIVNSFATVITDLRVDRSTYVAA